MRRLHRPTVSLPTLVDLKSRYPLSATGSADGVPEGRWNDPDVRGAVYAMHGRVCAYCQRLASDARGDIEHFRPKSEYPWLMYEFANYLLGCRVCNSNRKSNKFPLAPRAKKVVFQQRMAVDPRFLERALESEKRLLVDPAADPVEDWVDLDFDNPLCRIVASGIALHDGEGKRRVPKTLHFFGLNTIPELIQDRVTHVNETLDLIEEWRNGDTSKVAQLQSRANRYKPHGWAARRVLAVLAPEVELPTVAEDLNWFVEESLDRLDLDDLVLADALPSRDRNMVEQRRAEICWTLAVLWREPPGVPPERVEAWIASRGRKVEIERYRRRL